MERRELFKLLGAGLVVACDGAAQYSNETLAPDVSNYKPRFFSDQEFVTIDALTEIIIPADGQSPGAHAAGVGFYIDTVLHYADAQEQQAWRNGLASIEATVQSKFGKAFLSSSPTEQDQLVAVMARNERAPATDLERFFPILKTLTLEAFALSKIGMTQYLGYYGNIAQQEFPGCTHPEHQTI